VAASSEPFTEVSRPVTRLHAVAGRRSHRGQSIFVPASSVLSVAADTDACQPGAEQHKRRGFRNRRWPGRKRIRYLRLAVLAAERVEYRTYRALPPEPELEQGQPGFKIVSRKPGHLPGQGEWRRENQTEGAVKGGKTIAGASNRSVPASLGESGSSPPGG
jgi:hypothetical protein